MLLADYDNLSAMPPESFFGSSRPEVAEPTRGKRVESGNSFKPILPSLKKWKWGQSPLLTQGESRFGENNESPLQLKRERRQRRQVNED